MKKSSTSIISFLAICIALNYVGANIALFLKLPIYLDTIGTVLAGIVLGPLFGGLTGLISGLLSWATTDIFALYFSPIAILMGILAGYLIKPTTPLKDLWWKALFLSLPGTILSSLITVILFHGITSSGSSLLVQVLHGVGLDLVTSTVLVQVITDYADRFLTVFICILACQRLKNSLTLFQD